MRDTLKLCARYVGVSIRSQMQYRASFAMQSAGQFLAIMLEFAAIWALFNRFGSLRGWTLAEVAIFCGIVHIAFALAESFGRGFDVFPQAVKSGEFDRLLVRPRGTALQVGCRELHLRCGRLLKGAIVLGWGVWASHLAWPPAKVLLLLATIAGGCCVFIGLFVIQATLAFWTVESLEILNTVTYGGTETAQFPLDVYKPWFRRFFTFVVPLACVSYYPILAILEHPGRPGPEALLWLAPLVGLLFLRLCLWFWAFGERHYMSTGELSLPSAGLPPRESEAHQGGAGGRPPEGLIARMRLGCLLALLATTAPCSADLALVPYPRELAELPEGPALAALDTLAVPEDVAPGAVEALLADLARERGAPPRVVWAPARSSRIALGSWRGGPSVVPPAVERGSEAYRLRCDGSGVAIAASTAEGLTRGLATLRQLVRANVRRGRLPGVEIEDWPALRWRVFQDDLTRGPSSKPEYLAREVALGASLKLNAFTWYMESQYAFPRHRELAPPDGALTPDELRDLVREGARHGVDILGNQQSFAHMDRILSRPEFAGIAETPYLLSPASEDTYRFLDDLYSGMLPELPFPLFNVCCDETVGLGTGPSREWAEREGVGAVYVAHVKRLRELVTGKYGKRMMMWGDIILTHPERLGEIPRDVVMLTWGYDARASFESQIRPFAESGFEFFVCPGASNWSRILPDFTTAARNIEVFTRDGARSGALGMLNTTWDDDGLTLDPTVWHAFAWGAECAWTGSTTRLEDFERRLGAVLFGEREGRFGRVMSRLRGLPVRWSGDFLAEPALPILAIPPTGTADAEARLAELRGILEDLAACRAHARDNADLLDYLAHGAGRMLLIEERAIATERNAEEWRRAVRGDETPADAVASVLKGQRALREAHAASRTEFVRLWDAINRPYARDWTTDRYDTLIASYDGSIAGLEAATGSLTLPKAEDVGVGVSALPSPRLSSARVTADLAAPGAWEAPEATWRLPLRIRVASEATGLLPVEADLPLPAGMGAGAVRAFAEGTEVPSQLDRDGRLVLVLPPGARPAGGVLVTLYGGLPSSPTPVGAASAQAEQGRVWLGNDRVRLAVGAEGAHIYRWEVTALGGRDATLAGESSYDGFSDVNTWRASPHTLAVTSSGPALARCYAIGPGGLVKSISLYAGAGWVEVTLSRPTGYYWDFEDPALFAPDAAGGRFLFDGGGEGPAPWPPGVVAEQVAGSNARWAAKLAASGLLLGLVTPGVRGMLTIGPGEGAGGVGLQRGEAASRFVTYCDVTGGDPRTLLDELAETLDPGRLPVIEVGEVEGR